MNNNELIEIDLIALRKTDYSFNDNSIQLEII